MCMGCDTPVARCRIVYRVMKTGGRYFARRGGEDAVDGMHVVVVATGRSEYCCGSAGVALCMQERFLSHCQCQLDRHTGTAALGCG